MQTRDLVELNEFAVELAQRAGRLTLDYFQKNVDVDIKADGSPVTIADFRTEELLRREIKARFPDDGFIGEELGVEESRSGRTWILDPIDGTKPFIHGVPIYGVLIALEVEGEVELGVVYLPGLDETVSAFRSGGCWWNGRPSRVSDVGELDDSLVLLTDIPEDDSFDRLLDRAGLRKTWGGCYGYVLVATGRAEVMIDEDIDVFDVAAMRPIIEEAGGRFTDLCGAATHRSGNTLASNGLVHEAVLELVRPELVQMDAHRALTTA